MVAAEKALWYIESHYTEALSLETIASVAGVSPFHLARLFQAMTGCSVVRYLRARRLSEAARQLADGAPDILAIALASGYGSHEAFTRAFSEQFGLTPAALRARGTLEGLDLVEPWRTAEGPAELPETPRVVHAPDWRIVGIARRYVGGTTQGIPSQWQALYTHPFAQPPSGTAFGVFCNGASDGSFDYLAGFERRDARDPSAGLTRLTLPARRYAVALHRGHISAIRRTWRVFVGDWLPRSGLPVAEAPDFEKYSDDFDTRTGIGDVELWMPLTD
ncbi:AraC family transcriptional regulator [Pseudoxanthomonas winnipegensis]|uniref:AraC family transcriptional regulator n=1 Tax=Pseudoxanthomonas winnipegensis TaxID=2480810 RepID=A0A4V2HEU0_9GAMM|nr:AraC family transcriptional regulator [Pseudoxanthomonas winnipegensis]RZZ88200.1 AraC family transcriptional regulator [Pseudoxanthomonas winnipegensis]TAA34485.1 AraC family transcriptional regulator [Pseudoxanthomonas winnipegensis]